MVNAKSNTVPAALYEHCEKTYNMLVANAKIVVQDDGTTIVVWEGMMVNLIVAKLHLSTPYYTSITRALKRMGCIRQLRRGGGTAPSQWEIIAAPTVEAFLGNLPTKVQREGTSTILQNQIDVLNKRVAVLESHFQNIFQKEYDKQKLENNLSGTSALGELNGGE